MSHRAVAVGLFVVFFGSKLATRVFGDELVFENHVWTKYASNFTPVPMTTPKATYSFDSTACSERYLGTAEITVPSSISGTVVGSQFSSDARSRFSLTELTSNSVKS